MSGFELVRSIGANSPQIKPVEFDGISATLSHLLDSAQKSGAFSHMVLHEVEQ